MHGIYLLSAFLCLLVTTVQKHFCGWSQSQNVSREHSVPHESRQRGCVSLFGYAGAIPDREFVSSNRVCQYRDGGRDGEGDSSDETGDTHLGEMFKDLLMRSLYAIKGLGMLRSALRVQIGQSVSFVHIGFAIRFGQFRVLGTGLSNLKGMQSRPKSRPNQQQGRHTKKFLVMVHILAFHKHARGRKQPTF